MSTDAETTRDYASQTGVIATFTGQAVAPLNPDPETLFIEDIAHALSNACRFVGHVDRFYSVAQHSVLCSDLVAKKAPDLALTALMHDASEAYLSDIARPIKSQPEFGDVYKAVETGLEVVIANRFGLYYPYPEIIKWADNVLLRSEQRDLMPRTPEALKFTHGEFLPFFIEPWLPAAAEVWFLETYARLSAEVHQ